MSCLRFLRSDLARWQWTIGHHPCTLDRIRSFFIEILIILNHSLPSTKTLNLLHRKCQRQQEHMNTRSWWMRSYYQKLGLQICTDLPMLHGSSLPHCRIFSFQPYNFVLSNVKQVSDVQKMFLFMYSIHRMWSLLLWSSKSVNTFLVYCKNSYGEVLNSDFESFFCFVLQNSIDSFLTHCIIASPPWSADWVSWTPRWSCSRIDRTVASGLRPVSSKKFLETDDSTIHTMHFFFVNDERDKLLAVTAKQRCHKRFYWTIITVTILSILLYS